jgi:type III restriction enzyme
MSRTNFGDLRLVVSQQSDFDLAPYERFLTRLTAEGGPHQHEALEIATRYLLGGRYANLLALAERNWADREPLRDIWRNQKADFLAAQQLGPLLAGSIDHATGTGKSYVIFGAAMLALASGQVDRVLVLCPSVTIEDGLTRKFRDLVEGDLPDLLPDTAAVRRPDIVNAYEGTVSAGTICVENIHSAYDRTGSSIRDSFTGQGARTLVINDEAHHIYSVEGAQAKEWREFLLDPTFGFHRVLNLSGTCFIGNDYFSDVIHRYSIRQARDDRRIKEVSYWDGDRYASEAARWVGVHQKHEKNRFDYPGIKPITIFVTDKITRAESLCEDFTKELARAQGISEQEASKRTLVVSSAEKHKPNIAVLRTVDQPGNRVEFIFSVSMLTEGWDVKNVLQIVPHDKRAFDSRLLISQVLGRGLRLLPGRRDAAVAVSGHAAWGPEIRDLFDDVMETDERITSNPIAGSPHDFTVLGLEIERRQSQTTASGKPKGRRAGESLVLLPQRATTTTGNYVSADDGHTEAASSDYTEQTVLLDTVLGEVRRAEQAMALETGDWSTATPPEVRDEIVAALRKANVPDEMVSLTNRTRILAWLRPGEGTRRMSYPTAAERLVEHSTLDMKTPSMWRRELMGDATIALLVDNDWAARIEGHDGGQYGRLDSLLADESLLARAINRQHDERRWRTPVDVVITHFAPERKFLALLFSRAQECGISSWVKSPDTGFYSIPYALRQDGDTRNLSLNPDWILRVGGDVVIVETKEDGDASPKNRAKMKGATDFVAAVNARRAAERPDEKGVYRFLFLSPCDYSAFFDAIRDSALDTFVSRLGQILVA